MRGSITVQLLLFSLVFITLCISSCDGAKACCEKAQRLLEAQERAQAQALEAQVPEAPETQVDEITTEDLEEEEEEAPDEYNGQKRWIADPSAEKPQDWDDEDDGEWQPRLIENPEYEWKPKEELKTPSLCSQHEELEQAVNEQVEESLLDKLVFELEEAMGWIILGIFITALMSFANTESTNNTNFFSLSNIRENLIYYHEKNTFVGLFMAGILGLCTPLCSCGALPLASSLAASSSNNNSSASTGASTTGLLPLANVLTFLTASQSAGLDSAAITLGLLGPIPALFRLFGALFISIVVGYFTFPSSATNNNNNNEENNKDETKEEKDLSDDTSSCCPSHTHTHTSSTTSNTTTSTTTTTTTTTSLIQNFLNTLQETSLDIFPTVLSGIVLSTLILHFFPSLLFGYHHQADSTLSSLNLSSFLIRLGILLSALPIQLCEHSSVTFAAGIQKSGGSPGIAFAFLLSAPATNISCLLLLLKTQLFHHNNNENDKNKFNYNAFVTVMRMSLSLCGAALLLSYVVDFFGMDMLVDKQQTEQNMYLQDDEDEDHSHENMTQEELELHLAEEEDHHHHHDHNDWFHFTSISLAIILWFACVKHFVTTKIMTNNKNDDDGDKLDECCDHNHHTHHTQSGHNKLKQS